MIRLFVRAALAASLAAAFTMSVARIALAVDERAWIALEAGADLYDADQALGDGAGFGLRATGFLNRWVGVDALYHHASPHQEPRTLGDATFSHYGAGLILTPQRTAWALPYIYGGIGQAKVERDGFSSKSSSAFHGGLGAVFRAGERIGLRLDARDVSWKQEDGPGRPIRVNEFYVSGGVTAFWLGRPRDTDSDGVPDKKDRCPETPDGAVVDAGGCPLDTDGDKVFDGLDKCASTPAGATVDATGCPLDADGDGVYDGIDRCNDTTKGVLVDAQGCPLDSDGDQVFDGPDQCPDTPKGAHVDASGCPLDADKDGVPDGVDTCPFTPPGTPVNAGGCPIALSPLERDLLDDWIIRLSDIEFVTDSLKLTPEGLARIEEVGAVLAQWPMLKFEVGVHSDNLGEDARRQPLSHLRARYILQQIYLKYPSLNAKNYYYTGYGDSQPLAPNKTPEGRARNRRAEFRLLNMDALTAERERRSSFGSTAVPPAPGRAPNQEPEPTVPKSAVPIAPETPPPGSGSAPATPSGIVPGGGGAGGAASSATPEPSGKIPPAPTPPKEIPPPTPPDSLPPNPAPPDSVK
jgi:outer membrane protein OmpA-like peptidoglycan-associated protein